MKRLLLGVVACILVVSTASVPAIAAEPTFHLEQIASGIKRPLYIAAHNGPNRLYIANQYGRIKVLERSTIGAPWVNKGDFLDLRSLVTGPFVGRGLLGMAFHPNFNRNRYFYVFYTRADPDPVLNGDIVIAEYRARNGRRARADSAREVLVIEHPSNYHFGGWMAFGPDGYMYVSTGDGAIANGGHPEDTDSRLAKILRFNPRKSEGAPGFVPPDNPFVGTDGDDLVWAYGVRHPWRASFDRATGDLWLPDVGQAKWEEVNRFSPSSELRGADLGWSRCEGRHTYPEPAEGAAPCAQSESVEPLIEYGHTEELCSVIGGYVHRGAAQPSLAGRYFYGDYCAGTVWSVPSNYQSGEPIAPPLDTNLLITSFGQDATGEVYLTALNGTVWHIVPD